MITKEVVRITYRLLEEYGLDKDLSKGCRCFSCWIQTCKECDSKYDFSSNSIQNPHTDNCELGIVLYELYREGWG